MKPHDPSARLAKDAALIRNLTLAIAASMLASVLFEVVVQAFPSLLPERHEYLAQRIANQNHRSWLDFTHRDEPQVHHRPSDTFRHHPLLGWTSSPNLTRRIWGYDGYFTVQTNADGFRNGDPEQTAASRRRILVLGDSFVWGLFLDNDELMPQRLQRELAGAGYEVDVMNYGMAGFGTDQELLVLREFGPRLDPSLVVLAFFYSNDFEDNARATSRWRGGRAKPYFTRDRTDELVLHNVPVPEDEPQPETRTGVPSSLPAQLRKHSVLANLARSLTHRSPQTHRHGSDPEANLTDAEPSAGRSAGHAITRRLLLEVEAEARQLGAPLVVALFPGYGFSRGQRAEYERAAEFFRSQLPALDVVDLTPAFERSEPTQGPLHGRFVEHWNAAGASLAARELSAHLVRDHAERLKLGGR